MKLHAVTVVCGFTLKSMYVWKMIYFSVFFFHLQFYIFSGVHCLFQISV